MTARLLAWGAHVSNVFALRVIQTEKDFGIPADNLMSCMAFETGETFSPSVHNPASSATGEIQFMNATAQHYGTTTEELAKMTAEKQFDYVWLYFRDAIKAHGPLKTLGDVYMAILNPSWIGKGDEETMWVSGSSQYAANAGLDANKDHKITRGEAVARVLEKLAKGQLRENAAVIQVDEAIPSRPAPKEPPHMNLLSAIGHFVWDHAFAGAARMAATADPTSVASGIAAVIANPMPDSGSSNSPAGTASGIVGEIEDKINDMVAAYAKTLVDQIPGIGGVAEVTGLDQKAADALKAGLVLMEQHALTYLSARFSAVHGAINNAIVPASNGAPVAEAPH